MRSATSATRRAVAAFARERRDRPRDGQRRRAARGGGRRRAARAGHARGRPDARRARRSSGTRCSRASCSPRSRPRRCRRCGSPARRRRSIEAIAAFGSTPVAVKPAGPDRRQGREGDGPAPRGPRRGRADYALELLAGGGARRLGAVEERIDGAEFTIQAISDGRTVVFPNSTYDYPYRFDGDEGPGTGGMGSLSLPTRDAAVHDGLALRAGVLDHRARDRAPRRAEGRRFNGVMNSGFFATADGVKVIEFNARFGDPECMNIMSLFDGYWTRGDAAHRRGRARARRTCRCATEASLVLYLVSPDYALRDGRPEPTSSRSTVEAIEAHGLPACSSPPPSRVGERPLPHRRHLARGRARHDRADARAGARAASQLAPSAVPRARVAPRRRRRAPTCDGLRELVARSRLRPAALVQGWRA